MATSKNPVDYLAAIEQMQQEQKKEHQIHSPEYLPEEDDVVDYTAAAKAWDKALRGRDVVNMPAQKGKKA